MSAAREKLPAICERIREGTHQNHAAALEGIPKRTYYHLLEHDEEAAAMVCAARAVAAESRLKQVEDAALGKIEGANANVLLHLLERAHPDEYAPPKVRTANEHSGPEGKPMEVRTDVVSKLTGDELLRAAKAILGSSKP